MKKVQYCWCKESQCSSSMERIEKIGQNEAGDPETEARVQSSDVDVA